MLRGRRWWWMGGPLWFDERKEVMMRFDALLMLQCINESKISSGGKNAQDNSDAASRFSQ